MPKLDELEPIEQQAMIEADTNTLTGFWKLRNIKMQEDRDRVNLIKPEAAKTDKTKWYTNKPKVVFDTSRALLSLFPPKFRLPMTMNYTSAEKDKMNKAERLCLGIWRKLDKKQGDLGAYSWLADLAYWTCLGYWSVFDMVQPGEEGPEFIADLWDPINVYPQWDKDGLVKCVRSYETDLITAKDMAVEFQEKGLDFKYAEPKEGDKPRIGNYWVRDGKAIFNAITINGILAKSLTRQTNLNRIPVHFGAIGSPDRVSANWQERFGESVIASSRDMNDYENLMISLMSTILAETAYPNIITKTRTGQSPFEAEDLKGYGSRISLKLEDQIELMKHAATPAEVAVLMQYVQNRTQQATLPDVVYGGIGVELSGYAISQLMSAIKYKLGPYLNGMQYCISQVMSDFLYDYSKGDFKPVTLSTTNPYDLKRGMTYIEEFSPDDVPKRIYVEVQIPISSQFDKTQAILNAGQALQNHLLSRETLWETTLEVDDAEQEKERIREDQVNDDPFIIAIEIIERLWAKVETYNAMGKVAQAEALKHYIMLKEMELGMRQGIPERGKGGGVPSYQMPAEARESPDMLRTMLGRPPASPTRPSQGPEERIMNRRASSRAIPSLVGPGGQPLT